MWKLTRVRQFSPFVLPTLKRGTLDLEVSSLLSNLSHHHYSSSGRRLLHYTMDELFYPRLYLTVQPAQPHLLNWAPNFISKYLRIITGTAPTLLSLILLFLLISLGSEMQQMKRS